ncbi:NADP(H)-dependent aldo-keto reductase [Corallincola spongiicola]|uniref:NADP(H)-dependent aldo-keto reductase n=1 Tax=Corallincola spongiicola TaxID=2520508 RepID=A0ABY1WR45_9GAMM|nr:NADP(H)-dependent aldo-keto reductase [Corallincola spongiicola]TAA47207.1 NADP(H)-dependent aldo-keto reductase [Corallincola spongiicola]
MRYHTLAHTDLKVSKICLGTMTFGEQNSEQQAHQQLDKALAMGVNFIDTAEMYPVPPKPETQGRTESHIGSWLKARGNRQQVVLATKVAGPGGPGDYIRANLKLDRANIRQAIADSLQRLQTDYVDLYQVHWPERQTNFFGQLGYVPQADEDATPILETLQALGELVAEGKVRHIGISNETPWGVAQYLKLAEQHNLPRTVTIQNPYNLLNRSFEVGLGEFAHREGVELLAYSPLAFGALSGKYLDDHWPTGARMTLYKRFARYFTAKGIEATQAYVDLAKAHGLDPAQMALAYINSRPFVASNIIGATDLAQLQDNISSIELVLSEEVLTGIEQIHSQNPNPCP